MTGFYRRLLNNRVSARVETYFTRVKFNTERILIGHASFTLYVINAFVSRYPQCFSRFGNSSGLTRVPLQHPRQLKTIRGTLIETREIFRRIDFPGESHCTKWSVEFRKYENVKIFLHESQRMPSLAHRPWENSP